MKYALIPLFLVLSCFTKAQPGQASDSRKFKLTIFFQENIDLNGIEVSYLQRNGHYFSPISYVLDEEKNTIVIQGWNHYVVGVPMPTILFTTNDQSNIDGYTKTNIKRNYYIIPEGRVDHFDPDDEVTAVILKEKAFMLVDKTETEGLYRFHHADHYNTLECYEVERTLREHAVQVLIPAVEGAKE